MLRGDVPRSIAKDTAYEVYVSIELTGDCKEATKIGEGFCPCVASALDCQHLTALVYNAERHADIAGTPCTGRPCCSTAEVALSTVSVPDDVCIPVSDKAILKHAADER